MGQCQCQGDAPDVEKIEGVGCTPDGAETSSPTPSQCALDGVTEQRGPHPPSFYCPISRQCMHDPVVLTDGHTYEREPIERWLLSNNTSPVTGAPLSQSVLVPNHALREAIEEFFEEGEGKIRRWSQVAVMQSDGPDVCHVSTCPYLSHASTVRSWSQAGSLSQASTVSPMKESASLNGSDCCKTRWSVTSSCSSIGSAWSADEGDSPTAKQQNMVRPVLAAATKGWQLDTLSLAELTDNRPLSMLGMHIFQHHGLPSYFNMDRKKISRFLRQVEHGYPASNPYHNSAHAATVLHLMHCILSLGGVAEATSVASGITTNRNRQQKLITLAGLLAAAVVDYEHEGVSNDFLVKSSSLRATVYSKSPNENHHANATWKLLQQPECDFLENLSSEEREQVHSLVLSMVLATDMEEHDNVMKKFTDDVAWKRTFSKGDAFTKEGALVALQIALKCADLGHASFPWGSHLQWVKRLDEENFAQGDQERLIELPEVSALMDRCKPGASDTQLSFFDETVLPMFRGLTRAFPSTQPMLTAVEDNYQNHKGVHAELELLELLS